MIPNAQEISFNVHGATVRLERGTNRPDVLWLEIEQKERQLRANVFLTSADLGALETAIAEIRQDEDREAWHRAMVDTRLEATNGLPF